MFIRLKNIKNKRYAYLVKNVWNKRKKVSKQKVIRYLGPVISLEKINYQEFQEFYNIEDLKKHIDFYPSITTFKKMLALELVNHNFEKKGKNFILDDITINLSKKQILKNNSPIVLELNEGFLCNYTLTKLFNFKTKTLNPKKEGLNFANTILQSGLAIDQELFINLFNKIHKKA